MVRVLLVILFPISVFCQCCCIDEQINTCTYYKKVLFEFGQSNAVSTCGDDFTLTLPSEGDVQIMTNMNNDIELMQFGVNTGGFPFIGNYSVGTVYAANNGYDYVFKFAIRARSLGEHFNPNDGSLWDDFVQQWELFEELLGECVVPVIDKALYVQGETDTQNLDYSNAFYSNLTDLVNEVESLTSSDPDWYFWELQSGTYYTTVNQALSDVANDFNGVFVDTDNADYCDNVHYSAQQLIDFANSL